MLKPQYTIFVEDYNVPLSPWYILHDRVITKDLFKETEGRICIDGLFYFERDHVLWGPDAKQFERAGDYFRRKLEQDRKYPSFVSRGHRTCFRAINLLIQRLLRSDLRKCTNKQLFGLYRRVYEWFARCWDISMVIQFADMGKMKYSESVKRLLWKKLESIGDPEVVFSRLTTPLVATIVEREQKAIFGVLCWIQKSQKRIERLRNAHSPTELSGDILKKVKKLASHFGWMQYYYIGPPATLEYYLLALQRNSTKAAARELQRMLEEHRELERFQKHSQILFTAQEWFRIQTIQEFQYLKEVRKEIHVYHLNYAMHAWYQEVGRRFGWSALQARYITLNEFEQLLVRGKSVVTTDILNERYQCTAYLVVEGKTTLIAGKNALPYRRLFFAQKRNAPARELKGSVAYPGIARGTVTIVNSTRDIARFHDGDVLVSFSTNPSLMPALSRAGAIVTNTGGITAHAAIVARELKIPCVIGTGIATQVLKDGDRVEVDATKGVVRKIN